MRDLIEKYSHTYIENEEYSICNNEPIDLMHNDVILWLRRLKSFQHGYS